MTQHKIAQDNEEWIAARQELLVKEKEFSKLGDELTAARQALPWRKIDKEYKFESSQGKFTLNDLFAGKSQLITYHFMYAPGWQDGCKSCSFWADQYDTINLHIGQRDVSLAVISRAPWQDFQAFKERMGWQFRWLSSSENSFNSDFKVSFPDQDTGFYNYREASVMEELPGLSVFFKDEKGDIFHTYSCYARGLDPLNATYQMLDLVPSGRNEGDLPFPMAWVNLHDNYS
ncbi:MAG: DUF899 domain-containing protein [Gammaproteobacteria bacterium]|nr:DUF899 domain-containing protein [Gammaproteobacteria bacterium]